MNPATYKSSKMFQIHQITVANAYSRLESEENIDNHNRVQMSLHTEEQCVKNKSHAVARKPRDAACFSYTQ